MRETEEKRINDYGAELAAAPTSKKRSRTSNEVKARYNRKTYQQYSIKLRKIEDADIIAKIEAERAKGYQTSDAIRNLIR